MSGRSMFFSVIALGGLLTLHMPSMASPCTTNPPMLLTDLLPAYGELNVESVVSLSLGQCNGHCVTAAWVLQGSAWDVWVWNTDGQGRLVKLGINATFSGIVKVLSDAYPCASGCRIAVTYPDISSCPIAIYTVTEYGDVALEEYGTSNDCLVGGAG